MQSSDGAEGSFLAAYSIALAGCAGNDYRDNYDRRRFGPAPPSPTKSLGQKLASAKLKLLARAGFAPLGDVKHLLLHGLRFVEPHAANLQWLYERLDDDESRRLLVQLIAYRALGYRRVKLPLNHPDAWRHVEAMEGRAQGCETIDPNFLGWRLPMLNLRAIGYPMELFYTPAGAVIQFVHQQYRCPTATGVIEAREGDVVVDAGGCWADTALYFSHRVGPRGRVYSYEFLPDNLNVYQRNLELNPELAGRIELLRHPVWSSPDVELFISRNGPGTAVTPTQRSPDDQTVRSATIDQLLERGTSSRVDFIKMDIEGAELSALHGAEAVLRTCRPRLAITVYHSLSDFWEIPRYIDALGLGYRFHLRHFTIHAEETVLFAACTGGE